MFVFLKFLLFLFHFVVSSAVGAGSYQLPAASDGSHFEHHEYKNIQQQSVDVDLNFDPDRTIVKQVTSKVGKMEGQLLGSERWRDKEERWTDDENYNKNSGILIRLIRSKTNETRPTGNKNNNEYFENRMDEDLKSNFGFPDRNQIATDDGSNEQGTSDEGLIGSTSDYVLIAMIVAMMFCMTLCCLCLFCRSSSRLSICGINFELNDRRNSMDNGENLSEIHEVVPLTPTTAGDYNHRIQDIESMLRSDAPPPMYNEIVKRAEAQGQAKAVEAKGPSKGTKRKTHSDRPSETSSGRSNGGRNSWRISGRSIFASFRAKSSILRSRRSDSALQCPTVHERVEMRSHHSDQSLPPTLEELESGSPRTRIDDRTEVTVETVNEVIQETGNDNAVERNKVFVYDVNELHAPDDDDVFL